MCFCLTAANIDKQNITDIMINMGNYLLKYKNCNSYIVFMSLFVLYFITHQDVFNFAVILMGYILNCIA